MVKSKTAARRTVVREQRGGLRSTLEFISTHRREISLSIGGRAPGNEWRPSQMLCAILFTSVVANPPDDAAGAARSLYAAQPLVPSGPAAGTFPAASRAWTPAAPVHGPAAPQSPSGIPSQRVLFAGPRRFCGFFRRVARRIDRIRDEKGRSGRVAGHPRAHDIS